MSLSKTGFSPPAVIDLSSGRTFQVRVFRGRRFKVEKPSFRNGLGFKAVRELLLGEKLRKRIKSKKIKLKNERSFTEIICRRTLILRKHRKVSVLYLTQHLHW